MHEEVDRVYMDVKGPVTVSNAGKGVVIEGNFGDIGTLRCLNSRYFAQLTLGFWLVLIYSCMESVVGEGAEDGRFEGRGPTDGLRRDRRFVVRYFGGRRKLGTSNNYDRILSGYSSSTHRRS